MSNLGNEKLDFSDYPSDDLIVRLTKAQDADEDELLLLAQKSQPQIKKRVLERSADFRKLAELDDKTLDVVMAGLDGGIAPEPARGRKPRASRK